MSEVEKEVYLASHDKILKHFKNKDMTNLKNLVNKWIYMVGMTNKVAEKDAIAMTQVIVELFPNMTLKEIELAIKYSMQGKLDVDADCYGNFSPMYISKILKSYIQYSKTKIKEVKWREMSMARLEEPEEPPYEQRVVSLRNYIKIYIQKVTYSDKYVGDFSNHVWELLKRVGLLDPRKLNLEEADKQAEHKAEIEFRTINRLRYNKMTDQQRKEDLERTKKMYGRHIVMRKIFTEMEDPYKWLESLNDKIILPK